VEYPDDLFVSAETLDGDVPYQILSRLGKGGMATVYRARDTRTGRDVALKVVTNAFDGNRLERFRREGQIAAALDHPAILKVHAAGSIDGQPCLAYELVEGCRTLDEAWAEVDLRGRVELLADAAEGLGYAHAQGVVHRDLKPANVLIDEDGRLRVADFGLASAVGQERITETGAILGTPTYMAPEQVRGKRELMGPATDVWALGVLLYEAITGATPYSGEVFIELATRIIRAPTPRPSDRTKDTPADLDAVCLKAMAKLHDDRYPDGAAFAADLRRWLAGDQVAATAPSVLRRVTPRGLLLSIPAVVAGLAVGLAVLLAAEPPPEPRPADADPPRLTLDALGGADLSWEPTIEVLGTATDPAEWVEVRLYAGPGVAPCAVSRLGQGGGSFRFEVQLEPGVTDLAVEAVDAIGNATRGTLRVRHYPAPEWFRSLPSSRRPPLPLPPGVTCLEAEPGRYVNARDGSQLVWIPAATYRRGAMDMPLTGPIHEVRLSRGFFIGVYEVTWEQFLAYCADAGEDPPQASGGVGERQGPVFDVTWFQASDYCRWAGLRLPSEAEWELAAGAGEGLRYPWGFEVPSGQRSNLSLPEDGELGPAVVGSFHRDRSPAGCLDMGGNVSEWVADWYSVYPSVAQIDPVVVDAGPGWDRRVVRGGCWREDEFPPDVMARVAFRSSYRQHLANHHLGFRVAVSPPAEAVHERDGAD
jgi:formylglycine-generating enzyme required for sulfatase activity